jgi:hypothetical protein
MLQAGIFDEVIGFFNLRIVQVAASVRYWSEFLATDPGVRV